MTSSFPFFGGTTTTATFSVSLPTPTRKQSTPDSGALVRSG